MTERRRRESADFHGSDAARGGRTDLAIGFGIGFGIGIGPRYRTPASGVGFGLVLGVGSRHHPRLLDPVRAKRPRSGVRAARRGRNPGG